MNVRRIRWDGFRIPLLRPFETAHGALTCREGLLVQVITDLGLVGLGEISPLPAFSGATVAAALAVLRRWAPALIGVAVDGLDRRLTTLDTGEPGASTVRCGLDVAACDVLARARGSSVAELLGGVARPLVPVNATVASVTPLVAAEAAGAAVAAGYRCVKLKVGTAPSWQKEVERVAVVREAIGPATRLRLDANGAWDVDSAIRTLQALERFDLELVEQPVPADDLVGLGRVRHATRIPIAADESVSGPARAREILETGAADVLIVKPMVVGGLRSARAIVELARLAGRRAIVTTTIDAGIGTMAALHLAATVLDGALAHGIATGALLAGDLIDKPLAVERGAMRLFRRPGLGVEIDPEQLRRFGSGVRGEA
ncbi:MAG: mandelate racemase/muconate lactonizing enzyme family protein [Chloroflexota bacterium]